MLVHGKEILNYAKENKCAIPAFGCVNLEGVKAIIKAAEDYSTPVIIQMTEGGIKYAGLEELFSIASIAAQNSSAQICLHLDHGRDIELVKKAIDIGFTSVMYDGSNLPIEENIINSKAIKDYIGLRSISLEVEVGEIGGKEDGLIGSDKGYASIEDVCAINEAVNPDSIAVAVGTSHGVYKQEVKINNSLIKLCSESTNKPIVLHGTSGVPVEMVQTAISNGILKVNYDTELKQEFIGSILEYMGDHDGEYDIRKIFGSGIEAQTAVVKTRIENCLLYENIN